MSGSHWNTIRPSAVAKTIGIAAAMLLATAGAVRADRLVAKGTALAGKVTAVTTDGVEFQPDFAKDSFLVPWDNVDDLSTEDAFTILHGESGETSAPITAYRDGKLVVGDASIEPKSLVSAVASTSDMPGFRDRMRSAMRYWHGGLDFGLAVQQATTDNLGIYFAVHALRSKEDTRLILAADYRYGEEHAPGSDEKVTKDSASGLVRGEYDIWKGLYAYASTDALYDSIQNLGVRAVPKLGAGYTVWEREPKEKVRDFFQVEAGAGWVYEKYIHDREDSVPGSAAIPPDDDYFTIALGAAAAALLPREISVDWRFDYLPNVSDFSDYVIRTGAGLSALVIAPLSLRIALVDVYDSTPSGDSDKNSLNLDTTLSVAW